jgi:putative transposase
METALAVAPEIGLAPACRALGVSRATAYRHRRPRPQGERRPCPTPALALSDEERSAVLAQLHSERFADASPAHVYATLLDEGTYLASERTMYRVLAAEGETGERRAQLRHPAYAKPELLATGPNQLWSWDITKLKGPATWTWYHLYVLLDVFSRYVVGWLLADRESGTLADRLIAATVEKEGVTAGLTIHADRGSSMRSTWASRRATPGPTCPTTTPSARPSSRPSSTTRASPSASAPSRMPGPSAGRSSPGTTPSTATAPSGS